MASVVVVCPVARPNTTVTAVFDRRGGGPICVVNTRGRTALTTPLTIAPDPRFSLGPDTGDGCGPLLPQPARTSSTHQKTDDRSSATSVSATQHWCGRSVTRRRARSPKDPGVVIRGRSVLHGRCLGCASSDHFGAAGPLARGPGSDLGICDLGFFGTGTGICERLDDRIRRN